MAAKDILSKDEINALLYNTSDDPLVIDENIPSDNVSKRNYRDQSLLNQFPMLDAVNERFSAYYQLALSNLLGSSTEISLDGLQSYTFSDYAHSLFIPTSMNIVCVRPANETALFIFDPKLVFMLVDKYFGGDGRHLTIYEGREFSATELRLIEMILEKLLVIFKDAWSPLVKLELEPIGTEVNPQLTNTLDPDKPVIVITFRVCMHNAEGDLHVTMPRTLLEWLRKESEINSV